jgi:hypothetical protein
LAKPNRQTIVLSKFSSIEISTPACFAGSAGNRGDQHTKPPSVKILLDSFLESPAIAAIASLQAAFCPGAI